MKINVNDNVMHEFQYMAKMAAEHGSPADMDTAEEIVAYVLSSVADGSRRPGSWERQMLESMGLVVNCDAHQEYRAQYGEPIGNIVHVKS